MKTKYQLIAFLFLMLPFAATAQSTFAKNPVSTEIPQVKPLNLSAILDNNQLRITGNFESDKHYEVLMYDAHGYKVYSHSFSGAGTERSFDIDDKLSSGKYTVAVRLKKNNGSDPSISML